MDQQVSLQEAADRLGVHYMTAYRYVRLGRLRASKSGGQWWVDESDVDRLHDSATASPPSRRGNPNWDRYADRLLDRTLAHDEGGAWAVVESALVAGAAPRDVMLRLLCPVMRTVGDRWASGDLTVGDEHRVSSIVVRLVGRLGPSFMRRGRRRGTVVVGGAPGDNHGLPSAMVADVLRGEQFSVVDLGANAPVASFVQAAKAADRLVAVGLSVSTAGREDVVAAAIAEIRDASRAPAVILGGPAIGDESTARSLGADGWAPDAGAAADLLIAR